MSSTTTNNLPAHLTTFVGRTEELKTITEKLAHCRLLTLTGPGGIGKTRLAIEAAYHLVEQYEDGVFFVDLTPLRTLDDLVTAIAVAIGCELRGSEPLEQQLLAVLRTASALLLLDNFEHLLNEVGLVQHILETAMGVKIITTSREILNLSGEWVIPITGLTVPPDPLTAELETYSAIQLFNARAQQIDANFLFREHQAAVIEICRIVEGMPLALELAASWLRVLTCAEIVAEIQSGLDIFETAARDVPERQRSIRAVLEHSWNLLTPDEQQVFSALSVFRGGFTREAAQEITGVSLPILSSLLDKSLVIRKDTGRFTLHALIQQFAREKLNTNADRLTALRDRHCAYYATFLKEREVKLFCTWRETMNEVEDEIDNIRSCWSWAIEQRKVTEILNAVDALSRFFDHFTWSQEGEQFMARAITMLESHLTGREARIALAKALTHQGFFMTHLMRWQEGEPILHRSLELFQELEYKPGIAEALDRLGQNLDWQQKVVEAVSCLENSVTIARACNHELIVADSLDALGVLAAHTEKWEDAQRYAEMAAEIYSRLDVRWGIITTNNCLSLWVYIRTGRFQEAKQRLLASYEWCQQLGIRWVAGETYTLLAMICLKLGEISESHYFVRQLLELASGMAFNSWTKLYAVRGIALSAKIAASKGQKVRAVELLGLAMTHQIGDEFIDHFLLGFNSYELAEILKQDLSNEVYNAAVERGKALDLKTVIRELLVDAPPTRTPSSNRVGVVESLTEREIEVTHLIAQGFDNQEIADQLFVATSTVKKHINNIFAKLGVDDRLNAIIRAREMNIIE